MRDYTRDELDFDSAPLFVERKVVDVDFARRGDTLPDGERAVSDVAVVWESDFNTIWFMEDFERSFVPADEDSEDLAFDEPEMETPYVKTSEPVRAVRVREDGVLVSASAEEPVKVGDVFIRRAEGVATMDGQEFARDYARCAPDGTPVCGQHGFMHAQLRDLRSSADANPENTAEIDAHVRDVVALRNAVRTAAGECDASVEADAHLVDLMVNGADEGDSDTVTLTAGESEEATELAGRFADVSGKIAEVAGGEGDLSWGRLADNPGYANDAVRAMARRVFAGYTSVPLEEVRMSAEPKGANGDVAELLETVRDRGRLKSDVHEVTIPEMPDYAAEVEVHSLDGIDFMFVRDFMALSAYAWPAKAPTLDALADRADDRVAEVRAAP